MSSSLRRQDRTNKTFMYEGYDGNERAHVVPQSRITSLPKEGRKPGKGRLRRRNVKG